MAAVTIRKLSEETHRALKERAAGNGRSMQAEMRTILLEALWTSGHLKLGTYIFEQAREFGGVELDITRDRSPIEPAAFD